MKETISIVFFQQCLRGSWEDFLSDFLSLNLHFQHFCCKLMPQCPGPRGEKNKKSNMKVIITLTKITQALISRLICFTRVSFLQNLYTPFLFPSSVVCMITNPRLHRCAAIAAFSCVRSCWKDPTLRSSILALRFHWATSCRNEQSGLFTTGLFHKSLPIQPW